MSIKAIKNKDRPVSSWIRYKLVWNSPLVFLVFFGIDFIFYGPFSSNNTWENNLPNKFLWMALLALVYTHLYHQACYGWWLVNWEKTKKAKNITADQFKEIVNKIHAEKAKPNPDLVKVEAEITLKKKIDNVYFWKNFRNSLYFGLLVGIVLIAAIALSCYLMSVVYIYLLDGIRGVPETIGDDLILAGQTIGAGGALSICGKDESEGERDP